MDMKKVILALILLILCRQTAAAMTYEEETKAADEFIALLEANNIIVHDEEITWPVQMIADRLADHVKDPLYTFKMHVVRDRDVNAFTIPDGHIFINLGTLLFAKDMDELAAVIGHEMGHSQLRHLPQGSDYEKKVSIATVLGVLAGGLLATKNPEAGAAMMYSTLGGTQNIVLAYSRDHEYAADSFAKDILTASGIDPSGLSRFFIRLRTFSGAAGAPEYLLTHPITENRIASLKIEPGDPKPNTNYWLLEASVAGLMLPQNEAEPRADKMPEPYKSLALGLLQTKLGNNARALSLLSHADLPLAHAYQGLNLYQMGKKAEAYPLLKDYPGTARTKTALAAILQERGEYKEAITILMPFQSQDLQVDYTLGNLYEKTSKPALAHVSYARYFYKTKKYTSSIYHIDQALLSEKDLQKDTVKELKSMKELIKKTLKNQKEQQ